jgi:hypothetical protein
VQRCSRRAAPSEFRRLLRYDSKVSRISGGLPSRERISVNIMLVIVILVRPGLLVISGKFDSIINVACTMKSDIDNESL